MSVFPIGNGMVTQDQLDEYLAAENQSIAAEKHLALMAGRITSMLLGRAGVEPGVHKAELRFKQGHCGKCMRVRLKVK